MLGRLINDNLRFVQQHELGFGDSQNVVLSSMFSWFTSLVHLFRHLLSAFQWRNAQVMGGSIGQWQAGGREGAGENVMPKQQPPSRLDLQCPKLLAP